MNRVERKLSQRKKRIIGWIEHPSPKQLKQGSGWFGELDRVYRQGNDYVVMVRDIETEWGTVQHACIINSTIQTFLGPKNNELKMKYLVMNQLQLKYFQHNHN